MKSILAKQAPHSNPWLKMRARQAMQTGGSSRSAARPSADRKAAVAPAPKDAGEISRSSSPWPIPMAPIIRRGPVRLKAQSAAR